MLAKLKNINKKQIFISNFDGISFCHKEPFYIKATQNLCSRKYPSIATRKPYFPLRELDNTELFGGEELLYIKDNKLYASQREIGSLSDGKKQIARFNKKYIIMPDKLVYDSKLDSIKPLEASFSTTQIRLGLANEFADPIVPTHIGDSTPSNQQNGDVWLDTHSHTLKRFVEYQGIWNTVKSIYTVIFAEGIDEHFHEGDGISIEGSGSLDRSFIVESVGKGYITVLAKSLNIGIISGDIAIKRELPKMHELCTWQGRLWGINKDTCELYASKLGNPFVFYSFSGLNSDSYAMALEDTPLNIVPFEDELLIFFQNSILRLTGNRPSNFKSTLIAQRGLKLGSEHSAIAYKGAVYFIADDGVYCYNSMFRRISEQANVEGFAIGFKGKYMIFTKSGILSFDISNNTWYCEAPYSATSACIASEKCYFIADGILYSMAHEDILIKDFSFSPENSLKWYMETGPFSLILEKRHKITRLGVNIQCKGKYKFELLSKGKWITLKHGELPKALNISVNIALPHEEQTALRISGEGNATIYSITQDVLI